MEAGGASRPAAGKGRARGPVQRHADRAGMREPDAGGSQHLRIPAAPRQPAARRDADPTRRPTRRPARHRSRMARVQGATRTGDRCRDSGRRAGHARPRRQARPSGRHAAQGRTIPADHGTDQGAVGRAMDPSEGHPRLHDRNVPRGRPHGREARPVPCGLDSGTRPVARRIQRQQGHLPKGRGGVRHEGDQPVPAARKSPEQHAHHRDQGLRDRNQRGRQAQTRQRPAGHHGRSGEGRRDPRRMEPVGVQGPRKGPATDRNVQSSFQQHPSAPCGRILSDHARHRGRHQPAPPPEGRGGARPAQRRGHAGRARGRRGQDVRGRGVDA